jgi:hypothetical protein
MDDFLKDRADKLIKSMYKAVMEKSVPKDVFDSDKIANVNPDEVAVGASSAMKKKKDEDCDCKDKNDCECEDIAPVDDEMEKREKFVKSVMDSFKAVSNAYLKKMELEKGRMATNREMQPIRDKKQSNKLWEKWNKESKKFKEHQEKIDEKEKDTPPPVPKKMAASEHIDKKEGRCWEGYEPTPGVEPYSEGSCQKKSEKPTLPKKAPDFDELDRKAAERKDKAKKDKEKKAIENAVAGGAPKEVPEVAMKNAEKPFHGYNKNKHSKKGGLSKKGRDKINREEGSNLKAPVSSKAAKKSPKKAARRKSFCARMSGVKGPTSKKGKLTPKGAALKRWDC